MTELQQKEFELLKEFVHICDQLHLTYYLVCGSALGAVKYGGFIPWDDDVDVAMCREEYDVFLEKAPALLPKGLFLQTYRSDPGYPQIYCKLRNSDTTYIEQSSAHLPINHGIYIDVFPLDGYPQSSACQKRLELGKRYRKIQQASIFNGKYSLKVRVVRKLMRVLGVHKRARHIAAKFEKLISRYPTATSTVWCNHGNWQGKLEYAPRLQYGEGAWATFEGLQVRVPQLYDEYLTQKYGDWRADLPPEQQVGHHYYTVMDTEKPYTEYLP